jgi:hypothetical protein
MPWPIRLGDGNRWELCVVTVLPQGVAPQPMQATCPPDPAGSTCQGPRPEGYEGARRESLAVVKATRLGEITLDKPGVRPAPSQGKNHLLKNLNEETPDRRFYDEKGMLNG